MAPVVVRQLPLVPSSDLWDFVGTGAPSDSPGVPAAIGSRFLRTDGGSGTVEYRKYGAADTQWENALGGGGGGGSAGVTSVAATSPIVTSAATGAITLSHANSAVTPGTYGDDVTVPVITVDAKGHVTSVVDTPIAIPGVGIPTHAWQPMTGVVAGVADLIFGSDDDIIMGYAPI